MSKTVQINFVPLLAAAFAYENKTYKVIDELCEKYKINIEKEILNNEWKEFIAAKEGNIESRYYYKKALALICCENGQECVYKIMKAGYRYVYTYVEQNSKCILKDFLDRFVKKNKGMDNISSAIMENTITCFMFLSNLEGKFVADDCSRKAASDVYLYFQGANENQTKFKNLDNELRKEAKDILKKVRKITGLNRIELDENIYNDIRFEEEVLAKEDLKYLAFARAINLTQDCENIHVSNILKRDISEKELIEIMVILIDYLSVRDMKIEDLGKPTLLEWLYSMIAIKRFAISYNEASNFFFNNFQEGLNRELQKERDRVKGLEIKNYSIQKDKEELLEQKRLIEIENKRLKEEMEKLQKDRMELISLRNFAFSLSEENEYISNELDENQIDYINSLKGVIVGGKDSWITKIKEVLSNWSFISTDSINFDKNLLKREVVIVNTNYLSHAMYYKVVENCKKINFINSRNVDISLKEINNITGTLK